MTTTTLKLPVLEHPVSLAEAIRYSIKTVGLWSARARQRRELAVLPHEFLDDIGITREEALLEARKPCWQA